MGTETTHEDLPTAKSDCSFTAERVSSTVAPPYQLSLTVKVQEGRAPPRVVTLSALANQPQALHVTAPLLGVHSPKDGVGTKLVRMLYALHPAGAGMSVSDSQCIKLTAGLETGSGPFQNVLCTDSHGAQVLTATPGGPGPTGEFSVTLAEGREEGNSPLSFQDVAPA